MIRAEVTEQIENTSDIGYSKSQLLKMYPELLDTIEINELAEAWWWRHPKRWINNNNNGSIINNDPFDWSVYDPREDAKILIEYNGKQPAAESKHMVRKRCQYFLKWLYSTVNNTNDKYDSNGMNMSPHLLENIAIFSHSCTIKEFEILLVTICESKELSEKFINENISFRKNTEIASFELPKNSSDIDWELVEFTVNKAKGILNHADLVGLETEQENELKEFENYAANVFLGTDEEYNYEDVLSQH